MWKFYFESIEFENYLLDEIRIGNFRKSNRVAFIWMGICWNQFIEQISDTKHIRHIRKALILIEFWESLNTRSKILIELKVYA